MRGKLAIFDKHETRRGELSQCALINLIQAQEPITFRFFPNYRLEESTVFACVRRNLSSPVRRPRREGIDFLGDQRFSVSRSLALYYPSSTRPLAIIRAYRITTYSHFPPPGHKTVYRSRAIDDKPSSEHASLLDLSLFSRN